MLGSYLFAPTQKFEGPRINDLRVTGTEYGAPIPWVQGHPRLAGSIAWASDKREIAHTTSSGGKGGGGGVESTTYTYEMDVLYLLTANVMGDVARIWKNGKLIWSKLAASDADSHDASQAAEAWTRMTPYTGASSQLPDPDYETAVGATNALAYRGRCTVFIKSLQLDGGGNIPNLTFEVATTGTVGYGSLLSTVTYALRAPDGNLLEQMARVSSKLGESIYFSSDWINNFNGEHQYTNFYRYDIAAGTITLIGKRDWVVNPYTQVPAGLSDTPCAAFAEAGNVVSIVEIPSGASVSYSGWIAITGGAPNWTSFHRKGGFVYALIIPGAGNNYIFKYPDTGGSAHADYVQRSPGLSYVQICVAGDYVYAYGGSGAGTVDYFDIATLTYQGTIAFPAGSWWGGASSATLFTGDNDTLWITNAYTGGADAKETWERVGGAWVLRATAGGDGFGGLAGVGPVQGGMWQHGASAFSLYQKPLGADTWQTMHIKRVGPVGAVTLTDETVQNVVSRLCLRAGLTAGQIDVTELSSITRNVRALAVGQVTASRSSLEILAAAYFFNASMSDKIYFRPRGSSSVVTIPYVDLAAFESGGSAPEPLVKKLRTDIELPAHFSLSHLNASGDYLPATQLSDRLATAVTNTVNNIQVPLALTPAEGKGIVDAIALDAQVSLMGTRLTLLGNYARLEPPDVVVATDSDGSLFRLRLERKRDAYPLLEFDAVLDDASALSSTGITSLAYTDSITVTAVPATELELMDIPILRDADDDAGFYAAARGVSSPWPGAVIYGSRDDVQFEEKALVTESAVMGTCSTMLGNWSGGRVFDEINTVTVDISYGTLTSSTRDTLLNNQTVNAMLIGSEVIQFRDATLVSVGRYTLSGLLRGGRGTEWAMTGHATGERCVKLSMTGLRRVYNDLFDLGLRRYYLGVSIGRRLDSATSETFTNNGVGLEPFSPFDLRATRDGSGNITFTWQRRTRLAVRVIGTLGISIPLGEDSEAYDLQVWNGSGYTTLKRTITATTTSAGYTSAEQTTDFGSNQNPVYCRVYQRSAQVGLGYKLEASA